MSDRTAETLRSRHLTTTRDRAKSLPRSEEDQTVVDGWPLYRTPRGQEVFNEAMATMKATAGAPPPASTFQGCNDLLCQLKLPAIDNEGWMPAGRLWVSPQSYVLLVKSPRQREFKRRSVMNMQYFVFHEFHNSSRNTDINDTISSHSRNVFVPFYMSKTKTDAQGRSFVIVAQVAPHDVVSVHASNMGSAGSGVEVASNSGDVMEPLQGLAGIVLASMVKEATPRVRVVNHRGSEGLAMLRQYDRRAEGLRGAGGSRQAVALPFTAVSSQWLAAASGRLDELILRGGASPRIPVSARGVVANRPAHEDGPVFAGSGGVELTGASALGGPKLIEAPRSVARPVAVKATDVGGAKEVDPPVVTVKPVRPWNKVWGNDEK